MVRRQFNSAVRYKGRAFKWDTVIEQKTMELCRQLVGRARRLDFSNPSPKLDLVDDRELRRAVLTLSQSEARRMGIGKRLLTNQRNEHAEGNK